MMIPDNANNPQLDKIVKQMDNEALILLRMVVDPSRGSHDIGHSQAQLFARLGLFESFEQTESNPLFVKTPLADQVVEYAEQQGKYDH